MVFHDFLGVGNCMLGEKKLILSAQLEAHEHFSLLRSGEGSYVWNDTDSHRQLLQGWGLESIQQQLVYSLQVAPKFKKRTVLQIQRRRWKQWGRRWLQSLLGCPWCGSLPWAGRWWVRPPCWAKRPQHSGICSLSFLCHFLDPFQGKDNLWVQSESCFTLSYNSVIILYIMYIILSDLTDTEDLITVVVKYQHCINAYRNDRHSDLDTYCHLS